MCHIHLRRLSDTSPMVVSEIASDLKDKVLKSSLRITPSSMLLTPSSMLHKLRDTNIEDLISMYIRRMYRRFRAYSRNIWRVRCTLILWFRHPGHGITKFDFAHLRLRLRHNKSLHPAPLLVARTDADCFERSFKYIGGTTRRGESTWTSKNLSCGRVMWDMRSFEAPCTIAFNIWIHCCETLKMYFGKCIINSSGLFVRHW